MLCKFLVKARILKLIGNLVSEEQKTVVAHCGTFAVENMCRRNTEFCGPFGNTDKCVRFEFVDEVDLLERLHVRNIHNELFVDAV